MARFVPLRFEPPFLRELTFSWGGVAAEAYPFNLAPLRGLHGLRFTRPITFFIGENGSGKSTLLEGIARICGFNSQGGNRNHLVEEKDAVSGAALARYMKASWQPKMNNGFFLRAETFFNFAHYMDTGPGLSSPYWEPLLIRSHGEGFMSLFKNQFGRAGIYLLDEPEAALSPQRQLAFLRLMHDLERLGQVQFIIATHSPILLAYPGADILNFDVAPVGRIDYEATEHYRLTRDFLNHRERYLGELFKDEE